MPNREQLTRATLAEARGTSHSSPEIFAECTVITLTASCPEERGVLRVQLRETAKLARSLGESANRERRHGGRRSSSGHPGRPRGCPSNCAPRARAASPDGSGKPGPPGKGGKADGSASWRGAAGAGKGRQLCVLPSPRGARRSLCAPHVGVLGSCERLRRPAAGVLRGREPSAAL